MKKCMAVLLSFAMLLSLCACSTASDPYKGTGEELDTILGGIAAIPIATMGVSMIITNRAVELLDWCMATTVTAADACASVKAYYDTLDTAAQEMFIEQLSLVTNACESLANDDSRSLLLESAGLDKKLTWDTAAFEFVATIGKAL